MDKYEILSKINSPDDLKSIEGDKMPSLCSEIRSFLIDTVEKSGGHLASNLGAVELTVAVHRVFDSPRDHIIFDVGHQAYVHKILTGRKDRFQLLRVPGGLSGFTTRREGEHDCFGAGHSSTSVSAALGFATADKLNSTDAHTVCIIGDGAYTGGMVHEALNNCTGDLPLIIILNENGMSISKNQGAFASYISKVRFSRGYLGWKRGTISILEKLPLIGHPIRTVLSCIRNFIKRIVYTPNYFEELGLHYIGPVDGHDCGSIERSLQLAKRIGKTTVVHLKTVKGKGYAPAESMPDTYHSVNKSLEPITGFSSVASESVLEIAETDSDVVAVTAAMGAGTCLDSFGVKYPDRYFDVGIAEEHAVTFASGLSAAGKKPIVAIYSTFLQRAYDNILHDAALQRLHMTLLVDRAGLSVGDGATHHGIFDVSFLSSVPDVEIYAPSTYDTLREMISESVRSRSICAIRYSNCGEDTRINENFKYATKYARINFDINDPPRNLFVTFGKMVGSVIDASERCTLGGYDTGIVVLEKLKPIDGAFADVLTDIFRKVDNVLFVEEGIKNGGAAMLLGEVLRNRLCDKLPFNYRIKAIEDDFVIPTEVCDLFDYAGFSSAKLYNNMINLINGK